MKKPYLLLCLALLVLGVTQAQDLTLRKGYVLDSLPLQDSVGSRLSLYLPTNFEPTRKWPLLFMAETEGDTRQALRYLKNAAENNGYVLASSKALGDSISLTQKVLYFSKSLDALAGMLPVDLNRIYVTGYGNGGELAALLPNLMPRIQGVLLLGSGLPNWDLIRSKSRFHFVGITGQEDYRFINMLDGELLMDSRKVPNHVLYVEGGAERPEDAMLDRGLMTLTLMGMAGGQVARDPEYINLARASYTNYVRELYRKGQILLAYDQLEEVLELFGPMADTGELKALERNLKGEPGYRNEKRDAANFRLRERILREDYAFYLEEDILSFNLDNLGWWKYQMESIATFKKSAKPQEQLMGVRLESYVNALIEEYLGIAAAGESPDDNARILLRMVKTLTAPDDHPNYLALISLTAKYNDFGTALFYLEELLKKGFSDREALYSIPDTALLRISPEFNALVSQYLKDARYELPEPPPEEWPGD